MILGLYSNHSACPQSREKLERTSGCAGSATISRASRPRAEQKLAAGRAPTCGESLELLQAGSRARYEGTVGPCLTEPDCWLRGKRSGSTGGTVNASVPLSPQRHHRVPHQLDQSFNPRMDQPSSAGSGE
jgi:hypothetical protein